MKLINQIFFLLISNNYFVQIFASQQFKFKKQTSSQPLINYVDEFYLVNISLGTPPQHFLLWPSTCSSHLWVYDSQYKIFASKSQYGYIRHYYTPNDSVSQSTNGTESVLTYVEDTLHGQIYTDNITAGILSSTNQTFVSVDNSHLHSYDQMPMDGVLGLGWPRSHVAPPLQNFFSQLQADEFTIYLKRHQAPPNGTIGGLITYGGKDYRNCNPVWTHIPITLGNDRDAYFWNFETTNFSIGNEVVSETMGYGLVCHATANIGLIMKVWHKLLDAVKAAYNKTLKMNTVKCSTVSRLPDLVFNISGKLYPVPAYQYINKIPGEDQICELAVEMSPEEVYILGNPFLRTYCSYFDYAGQRIGFSIAKQPDFK